jgi:hypothetical protein
VLDEVAFTKGYLTLVELEVIKEDNKNKTKEE